MCVIQSLCDSGRQTGSQTEWGRHTGKEAVAEGEREEKREQSQDTMHKPTKKCMHKSTSLQNHMH